MPEPALSDEGSQALIAYALSPALRPVREALAKLDPKPTPEPLPERRLHVPSTAMRKKRR